MWSHLPGDQSQSGPPGGKDTEKNTKQTGIQQNVFSLIRRNEIPLNIRQHKLTHMLNPGLIGE